MNRRNFLRAFTVTAGGILVAEELLSTKTYFLPPRRLGVWQPLRDYYAIDVWSPVTIERLWIDKVEFGNITEYKGLETCPL